VAGGGGGGGVTVTDVTEPRATIGQTIVINGTGFTAGQAVLVDGQTVTSPTFDSSVQITATVPAGVTRDVTVDVSVAGVTLVDAFIVEPKFGADEPTAPATEILIADFAPGDLNGGGLYLFDSFNTYTDNGNDIALVAQTANHYGNFFGSGALTAWANSSTGKSLITGRGGSGLAMRNQYSASTMRHIWQSPWINGYLGTFNAVANSLVVEVWVRFPDAGNFYGNVGGKFIELWYSTSDRIQLGITGGAFHFNPGGVGEGQEIGEQPVDPHPGDLNDANWHRAKILIRNNTSDGSPSSRDGRAAAWVNGTKICDVSSATIGVTPSGGSKEWCSAADVDALPYGNTTYRIAYLQFPELANDITGTFNVDHDDLKVWVQ
jgi:hypothetical protein